MRTTFLILGFILNLNFAFAQKSLSYNITVDIGGEFFDSEQMMSEAKDKGWTQVSPDENSFIKKGSIALDKLPLRLELADFSVLIEEKEKGDFFAQMSFSIGDADQEARTSTYLRTKKENKVTLSGGDYASGMWYGDAKLKVSFK